MNIVANKILDFTPLIEGFLEFLFVIFQIWKSHCSIINPKSRLRLLIGVIRS